MKHRESAGQQEVCTAAEYRAAIWDVVYLAACVVNHCAPDVKRVQHMNLTHLYRAAKAQLLTAIVAEALEQAGVADDTFRQAKAKAIRKNVLFEAERAQILAQFEEAGIWYMPLKGSVLQAYYPGIGLRQMADNDILFDSTRQRDVRRIMERRGYQTESYGQGNHDVYKKKPVFNFEMHTALFGAQGIHPTSYTYYEQVKERLCKDEGNRFGYHFSPEDFYVYMLAHAYKHYDGSGTGLRSVLDVYVYLQTCGAKLDQDYIQAQLVQLGMVEFEAQCRHLGQSLFGGDAVNAAKAKGANADGAVNAAKTAEADAGNAAAGGRPTGLSAEDQKMFDYMTASGTYGTHRNAVANRMRKKFGEGKSLTAQMRRQYLWQRLFPSQEELLPYFPPAKYKPLIPFVYVFRFVRGITVRGKRTWSELKIVNRQKKL